MKVFWSWQSDIDEKISRHLVKECLEKAIGELNDDSSLAEADREEITLDHDTKGVLGSPSITDTILGKIEACDVFIGDITPVAETKNGKKVMNPNVAIEMGYALAILSDERIVTIMNESFGSLGDLPFDLRHKRGPITYKLLNDSDKGVLKQAKQQLQEKLKQILSKYKPREVLKPEKKEQEDKFGIFFDESKPLVTVESDPWGKRDKGLFFSSDEPYVYFSVTPGLKKQDLRKKGLKDLIYTKEVSRMNITPFYGSISDTGEINKHGVIVANYGKGNRVRDFTQCFVDGKISGISQSFFHNKNIPIAALKNEFHRGLHQALSFMENQLELETNAVIEVGVHGVEGMHILMPNPVGKRYSGGGAEKGPLEEKNFVITQPYSYKQKDSSVDSAIKTLMIKIADSVGEDLSEGEYEW